MFTAPLLTERERGRERKREREREGGREGGREGERDSHVLVACFSVMLESCRFLVSSFWVQGAGCRAWDVGFTD